jgi:hypothetical protein
VTTPFQKLARLITSSRTCEAATRRAAAPRRAATKPPCPSGTSVWIKIAALSHCGFPAALGRRLHPNCAPCPSPSGFPIALARWLHPNCAPCPSPSAFPIALARWLHPNCACFSRRPPQRVSPRAWVCEKIPYRAQRFLCGGSRTLRRPLKTRPRASGEGNNASLFARIGPGDFFADPLARWLHPNRAPLALPNRFPAALGRRLHPTASAIPRCHHIAVCPLSTGVNDRRPLQRAPCHQRKRRQPPKVSGPPAAPCSNQCRAGAARRAATKRFKHQRPCPSKPSHRARSARPRRHPPQRVSHRACAMAASQPCPATLPSGLPIALARWLHPDASAIPRRKSHRRMSPIHGPQRSPPPAAPSAPRTKAA